MAKIKLTKTAVVVAQPQSTAAELRDTLIPGFLCKVTPTGRKVFMVQHRTNAGERRKPSLGLFGELTVGQARTLAQNWLPQVRRGGDPGGQKAEVRKAPTVAELLRKSRPIQANRVLGCIRKMFNLAERWVYRPDGSDPCRHVPKYPEMARRA